MSIQLSAHINIYKKKKAKNNDWSEREKKKKKNTVAIVATMSIEQTKLAL